jgi:hypothetical protein
MPSPEAAPVRPLARLCAAVGLVAALAAAAGAGAPATYGARTTADEPQYLLTALSLAEDGDLDIADELAGERWRDFHAADLPEQTRALPGGRRVSPHDPLLPLLLAPAMGWWGWVGAKLTLAVVAGALAALLTWTAVRRFAVAPRVAAGCAAVFALSVPLAPYGAQVYPELPAALVVTAAIALLMAPHALRNAAAAPPQPTPAAAPPPARSPRAALAPLRRSRLLGLAAAVVALPWLALKYAPVAAALALLGAARLLREGRGRPALGFLVGLAAAGMVFLALHQAVWSGWTPYASADHFTASGEFGAVGFAPDYLGRSRRLIGLLVDADFGLAAWQPAWLLAIPALAALARLRPPGAAVLAAPLAAGWLNATFVALTMQGWWFPGRQVVVVLPAAVLAVAWLADRSPVARRALAALGTAGVLAYAWLLAEALSGRRTLVVDFAATANPLYRAWSLLLPDYLHVTARTWLLHAAWVAAAAGLAWLGWRQAVPPPPEPMPDGQATENSVTIPSS